MVDDILIRFHSALFSSVRVYTLSNVVASPGGRITMDCHAIDSATVVTEILSGIGSTVDPPCVIPTRYTTVVPLLMSRCPPVDYVAGLQAMNQRHGLPAASLTYHNHTAK